METDSDFVHLSASMFSHFVVAQGLFWFMLVGFLRFPSQCKRGTLSLQTECDEKMTFLAFKNI